MAFSKNQFFLILGIVFIAPFVVNKLVWLANSQLVEGEMRFTGHGNLGSALGISSYPVIKFMLGRDSIYFNGNVNLDLKPGEHVMVRYQKNNPSDAIVNNFVCIWMGTVAYALLPILVLLVVYIIPDRLDPIIPKGSSVIIGKSPLIRIVHKKSD